MLHMSRIESFNVYHLSFIRIKTKTSLKYEIYENRMTVFINCLDDLTTSI